MAENNCNDFNDYQTKALRTLNKKSHLENVTHCAMGMVGEIGEFIELPTFNKDQRIGEVGDCLWYSAVLADQLGLKFSDVMKDAKAFYQELMIGKTQSICAVIYAAKLMDVVKKSVFYGKPLNEDAVGSLLIAYCSTLLRICQELEVPIMSVATININKLMARYPDKFDADRAINRDYDAESKAAGVQIV